MRDGNDLIHNLNITVTTALLGGTVEVPTVDGRAKIKIAPGTHAGKVLRLGGKGLPEVNGYGRGDELVVVDITIPSKLTAEEKRLVEQLAQQPDFQHAESVKNQNIFERMKSSSADGPCGPAESVPTLQPLPPAGACRMRPARLKR
mgnify:CR=1 FL=1